MVLVPSWTFVVWVFVLSYLEPALRLVFPGALVAATTAVAAEEGDRTIRYQPVETLDCNYGYSDLPSDGPCRTCCFPIVGGLTGGRVAIPGTLQRDPATATAAPPLGGFHAVAASLFELDITLPSCNITPDTVNPCGGCLGGTNTSTSSTAGDESGWVLDVRFVYRVPEDFFVEYSDINLSQLRVSWGTPAPEDAPEDDDDAKRRELSAQFRVEGGGGGSACVTDPAPPHMFPELVAEEAMAYDIVVSSAVDSVAISPLVVGRLGATSRLHFEIYLPLRVRYSIEAWSMNSQTRRFVHFPPAPRVDVVARKCPKQPGSQLSAAQGVCASFAAEPQSSQPLLSHSVPAPASDWLLTVAKATSVAQLVFAFFLATVLIILQ